MDSLAASVRGMPPPAISSEHGEDHPPAALPVLMRVWPGVGALVVAHGGDNDVAEAYSRLCSAGMRSVGMAFAPLLQAGY